MQRKQPESQEITEVKRLFGQTYMDFAQRFNPRIQTVILSKRADYVQCHSYPYPTLAKVAKAYSDMAPINWLKIQFDNLCDYVGVKEKMSDYQIEELSTLFYYDCYFLNIAEVALFMVKLKLGTFGEFYGTVDPLKIMTAKNQFLSERQREIRRYDEKLELQSQAQKRALWAVNAVTYETYRAMKRKQARQKIRNLIKKKIHRNRLVRNSDDGIELHEFIRDDNHRVLSQIKGTQR